MVTKSAKRVTSFLGTSALTRPLFMLGAASALLGAGPAQALDANTLPQNPNVVGGKDTFHQSGNTLNVNQSTNRTVIDWRSFDIGSKAQVNFNQPGVSAIAVNRVNSSANPTQIEGGLHANGQVWILNPNGVFFGKTARVDAAGIVASTANIDANAFMAGSNTLQMTGADHGAVENQGNISVGANGLAAFVAPSVRNSGTINATVGRVALAAGTTYTLDLAGDHLVELGLGSVKAVVDNSGKIVNPGGTIALTAKAAGQVVNSVVNVSGVVTASSVTKSGGTITLGADNVTTTSTAQLSADAGTNGNGGAITSVANVQGNYAGAFSAKGGSQSGNGGKVETSGKSVHVEDGIKVNTLASNGLTGNWTLDPDTATVTSGSGDTTNGDERTIGADTIVDNLSTTSFILQADSSIAVNSFIDASGQTTQTSTLTLDAPTVDLNALIKLGANEHLTGTAGTVNVQNGASVQNAVDVASATNGATINVYPGDYNESVTNVSLPGFAAGQNYGLLVDKDNITIQGVHVDGTVITDPTDVQATITPVGAIDPDGTQNLVSGNGDTITGLGFKPLATGENYILRITGDNFTLKNSLIDGTGNESAEIYMDNNDDPNVSIDTFDIEGNIFKGGAGNGVTVDFAAGVGVDGSPESTRLFKNNQIIGGGAAGDRGIQIQGYIPGVSWQTINSGAVTITGNTFSNIDIPVRTVGDIATALDWNQVFTQNTFLGGAAIPLKADGTTVEPGIGTSGVSAGQPVYEILSKIQDAVNIAASGDIVKILADTYSDTVTINKGITLEGADAGDRPELTGGILLSGSFSDLTLKDLSVSGDAGGGFVIQGGTVNNLTVDDVLIDGGNVAGRNGFGSGQYSGAISITNSEFKDFTGGVAPTTPGGATGWVLFDTRSGSNGSPGSDGTLLTSVNFSDNIIDNAQGGIAFRQVTNGGLYPDVTISGNTVENIGDAVNSFGGIFKVFNAGTVTFSGNNISGIGTSGFNPAGEAAYGAALLVRGVNTLNVADNTFTDNNMAFAVEPGKALPGTVNFTGNTFDNNKYAIYLPTNVSGSGTINFGAGNNFIDGANTVKDIVWTSSSALDLTGVAFNGKFGSQMSNNELFAAEDLITDGLDNAAYGLARLNAGNIYVTAASGSIQNGVAKASDDDTVNVQAGTYDGTVLIDKTNLTLESTDGAANTIIDAGGGDIAISISSTSGNLGTITIDGFTVQNWASGGIIQGMAAGPYASMRILNNVVYGPPSGATSHGNGIQVSGNGSVVSGNEVYGVHLNSADWSGSDIIVVNGSDITVENNIADGDDVGIAITNWNNTAGMSNIVIRGNTISNEAAEGISVQAFEGEYYSIPSGPISSLTITGNTVTDSASGLGIWDYSPSLRGTWAGTLTDVSDNSFARNTYQISTNFTDGDVTSLVGTNTFDKSVYITGGDTIFSQIQDGVDAATDGETVNVGAGTYGAFGTQSGGPVDIAIQTTDGAVVDGAHTTGDVVSLKADGTTLSGFTITNDGDDKGTGVAIFGQGVAVIGNDISDVLTGIQTRTTHTATNAIVSGNTIDAENGISLQTTGNIVSDNTIGGGVGLSQGANTFTQNIVYGGLYLSDPSLANDLIASDNTVNLRAGGNVQNAVYLAGSDGTLNLAAGTYTLPDTLYIDKSLSLIGAGESATTIDGSALNNGNYAMRVLTDDVSLSGFTLENSVNGSGGISVNSRITGLAVNNTSISNVTIDDNSDDTFGIVLFDTVGARLDSLTLNGNASNQRGVEIWDSTNVTLTNVTTPGNQYGVFIYEDGDTTAHQTTDINIDASNSFANAAPVAFNSDFTAGPTSMGSLNIQGFAFALSDNGPGFEYTELHNGLQDTINDAAAIDAANATVQGWTGTGVNNVFTVGIATDGTALSINTAANAATAGGTIDVNSGTYTEDVAVAKQLAFDFGDVTVNSLTVSPGGAGSSLGGNLTATGAIALNGATTVNGNLKAATFTSNATLAMTGNLTASGAAALNGASSITGNVAADSLTTGNTLALVGDLTAANGVTFGGASTVTGDISAKTFTANGTLALAGDLSATGAALFNGASSVSGNVKAASITANDAFALNGNAAASGAIALNGATKLAGSLTGGSIALGATTLTGNTALDTSAANGAIQVASVNGSTAGGQSLAIKAGTGGVSLGNVGATTRLGAVSDASKTTLTGSTYDASSFLFGGDVTLTAATTTLDTVQGGDITFNGNIFGTTDGAQSLTLNAGNDITLQNAGTSDVRLDDMTVSGDDFTALTVWLAGDYTSNLTGNQVFAADTLHTGGDVNSTVGGNASGHIESDGDVNIAANGDVSGTINGSNVTLSGDDVNADVTAENNANVQGNTVEGSYTAENVSIVAHDNVDAAVNATNFGLVAGGGTADGTWVNASIAGSGLVYLNGEPQIGVNPAQLVVEGFVLPAGTIIGANGQLILPQGVLLGLLSPGGGKPKMILVHTVHQLGELLASGYSVIVIDLSNRDSGKPIQLASN